MILNSLMVMENNCLLGTLMAAVPVALLNPSLGFRRKRNVDQNNIILQALADTLQKHNQPLRHQSLPRATQ